MAEKLELQVLHRALGAQRQEWQTVNRREPGEQSLGTCILDLLQMRDQWRMNEFPNASFRIVHEVKGKQRVIMS